MHNGVPERVCSSLVLPAGWPVDGSRTLLPPTGKAIALNPMAIVRIPNFSLHASVLSVSSQRKKSNRGRIIEGESQSQGNRREVQG